MDLGKDVEEMNLNVLFAESNDSPHNGSSHDRRAPVGPGRDQDCETEVSSGEGVRNGDPQDSRSLSHGEAQRSGQGSESDVHSTTAPNGDAGGSKKRRKNRKRYRLYAMTHVSVLITVSVDIPCTCRTMINFV